ncbi:DNA integrity scanning protein DisA nucleotide-binding domain protein [Candidatus Woesearchaeota archaeon]|nr:DNA integrity scanning protein DisA nucleotide-binding domain protein [Candidatus Woesearchaeota archaeon]
MTKNIEESIGHAATKIANDINANAIISIERIEEQGFDEIPYHINVKVTIFKQVRKGVYKKVEYETKIRKLESGSVNPIKEILMEGINKDYIEKGDRVVCVQDESLGTGYKGLLFIFDVDKIFFDISTHNLAENISSDVVESVINIALEIAKEGREGKRIGTAFVIGDRNEVGKFIRQLIINPFAGYSDHSKKITDPLMRETIKNFAQLDGAFVIDRNGAILTAGAYIDVEAKEVDLPPGFGTRHRNCAALTKETDSIAVVVSESGGVVRVIKQGKIIMKLPE